MLSHEHRFAFQHAQEFSECRPGGSLIYSGLGARLQEFALVSVFDSAHKMSHCHTSTLRHTSPENANELAAAACKIYICAPGSHWRFSQTQTFSPCFQSLGPGGGGEVVWDRKLDGCSASPSWVQPFCKTSTQSSLEAAAPSQTTQSSSPFSMGRAGASSQAAGSCGSCCRPELQAQERGKTVAT